MKNKPEEISDVTPGEILLEEWIKAHGLSRSEVARRTGSAGSRLTEIIKGRRSISADTALRLGRFFNTGERFWLNLQQAYDIAQARQTLGPRVEREVAPLVA